MEREGVDGVVDEEQLEETRTADTFFRRGATRVDLSTSGPSAELLTDRRTDTLSRDVLVVNMEFSCPPGSDKSPFCLRASSPPSTADRFPAVPSARQVGRSRQPQKKSRWAALESPEPAASAPAGQRCT